jgi:hypothetical protein
VTDESPARASRGRHPSTVAARPGRFAHPSEEVFATLLTLYGLDWSYEPTEFALAWDAQGQPTRAFRPDFYVASADLYIELTVLAQRLVTKKNQKVREFRSLYPDVALLVVYQRDFAELIARHSLGELTDFAA